MSSINFDNVYLLFIAIPLVVLLVVPFFLAVRKDNRNGHNIASGILHLLMAVLIAFTAAGTSIVTVVTETDVYVVADVSYSADRNLDTVDAYIADLSNSLPGNSRMGVICFGKNYKLLTRLGEKPKSVKEANVDDSETDIVSALEYAGSIFREGVIKRIVLITDGRQSDESDANALKRTVDSLTAEGVHVDAIYLDDNLPETAKEVQISGVDYTQTAFLNHGEKVTVTLQSSYDANVIVSLEQNGEIVGEKAVSLTAGITTVSLDLDTSEQGEFEYRVRIETQGEDENSFNNVASFTQKIAGNVKVLVITDNQSDADAARALYDENAEIDEYVGVSDVPRSVEELCAYDEIVLSNTDVSKIKDYTLFVTSLDTVVSLFGKSLVTIGNLNIQNRTEDVFSELQDMLPVKFGNTGGDSKLYTIVIDSSRSMESLYKLTKAKLAANHLLDLLGDDDSVCVVTFYGDVKVVQAPTKAANREEIKQKINDLGVTQGTYIGLGLSQALDLMKNLDYDEKQVMLMTDGLNFTSEPDDPEEIVQEMYYNYGIVTSVFDVGRNDDVLDTPSAASQEALRLLHSIASTGRAAGEEGYYYAASVDDVEELVLGEIAAVENEDIVTRNSVITLNKRFDETADGLENYDLSKFIVSGYVNGKAKANATTVFTTEYQNLRGGAQTVPIYSYWNYGNGKVSTLTAGVGGGLLISKYNDAALETAFLRNVFAASTPSEKIDTPFLVELRAETGYVEVDLTPATIRADASATVTVTSPQNERTEGMLVFDSTLFHYTFPSPSAGNYTVDITYSYGGYEYSAQYFLALPYLPEYDSFAAYDASVLYKMVGGNGIVSEDGKLTIVNDENEVATVTVKLAVPLLIVCVVLFAADIVVRKLKWSDIKSLFGRVNK